MPEDSKTTLEHLVDLVNDKISSGKKPDWPYVGLEHLPVGGGTILNTARASSSVSINNVFQAGDVLFGKLRPRLRKSSQVSFSGYSSTDILVLRPKAGTHPQFAGWVVSSETISSEAIRTEEGTKMPRTSWGAIKEASVFCPDYDEQTAIAAVLDNIDESIRQTAAVIEKLKKIKSGLLHDLLTRGIDENGQLRDPVRHPEQFKDSPLGKVPKAWEVSNLLDIAEIVMGQSPVGKTYNKDGKGLPLINGPVEFGEVHPVAIQWTTCPTKKCQAGDILFCVRGSTTGRLNISNGQYCIGRGVAAIRGRQTVALTRFVECFLQRLAQEILEEARGSGSTFPNISSTRLSAIPIPRPPLQEQQSIVAIISAAEARISDEVATLRKLTMMKQGLMQDLLRGRVRVPVDIAAAQEQEPVTSVKGKKAHETNIYFKRSVLAAEIVSQMHKSPTFGHVKFMKTLFLVEQLAHVALQGHYHRAAAGPLDNRMIRSVDGQMEKQKWFRAVRRGHADGNSGGYTYEAMEKAGGHRAWFEKYWEGTRAKIQSVIDILQRLDTQQCEIIATLYSAWADMLSAGRAVTDDAIITEVLTNWHESKQAITHDRWAKALVWMRKKELVPIMGGGE